MPRSSLFLPLAFLLCHWGQAAEPPGYYAGAEGLSGLQLRAALHAVIKNANALPYSAPTGTFDTSDALRVLEEAPSDSASVIVIYSGLAELKSSFGLSTGWNREHLWPQSYGSTSGFPHTDLHAMTTVLRACVESGVSLGGS